MVSFCCLVPFVLAALPAVSAAEGGREPAAAPGLPAPFQPTERGVYSASFSPRSGRALERLPVGELHAWVLELRDGGGHPFIPGTISISGGMPSHGHGLPSEPEATRMLGPGRFLVEGVLFNMPGAWVLQATVTGPEGLDTLRLAFEIAPGLAPAEQFSSAGVVDGTPATLPSESAFELLTFSFAERGLVQSLSLAALPPVPELADNRFAHEPAAQALGERLFKDPVLSSDGTVSCASCHRAEHYFSDPVRRSKGLGMTQRHAPTLVGAAYRHWFYWDGRRDSLWAQALTPLETAAEMGNSRVDVVRNVLADEGYRAALGRLAPSLVDSSAAARAATLPAGAGPFADSAGRNRWEALSASTREWVNTVFVLLGKVLAAYETTLLPQPAPFDHFAEALRAGAADAGRWLTPAEQRGLKLFIDPERGRCLRCHNGPLFTNEGFHNIGTGPAFPPASQRFDFGRGFGLQSALFNPFSCQGAYSDDRTCAHVAFGQKRSLEGSMQGAFKVPTLRNVGATAPYLHDGRHKTLSAVVNWYRKPPPPETSGHELLPVTWSDQEVADLVAFLETLTPL